MKWSAYWIAFLATSLLFALQGCAVTEPSGATQIVPPASYRAMWERAEACTGIHYDFDKVRVFVVPGLSFEGSSGNTVAGMERDGDIYIAEKYFDHPMVVRHEMIHALLASIWVNGHPKHPFESPCKATWETWDRTEPRLAIGGSAGGLRK